MADAIVATASRTGKQEDKKLTGNSVVEGHSLSSAVVDAKETAVKCETPNPLCKSELGVPCPQVASQDAERLRPD